MFGSQGEQPGKHVQLTILLSGEVQKPNTPQILSTVQGWVIASHTTSHWLAPFPL